MLVVRAQADVDPDVVQQRRDLQQQTLAFLQPVLVDQLVEQPDREIGDVPAVIAIEPVALAERLGTGEDLPAEVLGARAIARIRDVQKHAGAQRGVADDDPPGRGLGNSAR